MTIFSPLIIFVILVTHFRPAQDPSEGLDHPGLHPLPPSLSNVTPLVISLSLRLLPSTSPEPTTPWLTRPVSSWLWKSCSATRTSWRRWRAQGGWSTTTPPSPSTLTSTSSGAPSSSPSCWVSPISYSATGRSLTFLERASPPLDLLDMELRRRATAQPITMKRWSMTFSNRFVKITWWSFWHWDWWMMPPCQL